MGDEKCIQNFVWETWREETVWETRKWEDNIKMDLKDVGWEGVDWIHVTQDSFCKHGNEPSDFLKGGEFVD
jgi:hypothetical protein